MTGPTPRWLNAILLAMLTIGAAHAQEKHLVLLHTNDLHGTVEPWTGWEGELAGRTIGGLAGIAGVVEHVRSAQGAKNVLLLSAGDDISDSMIADLTQGQALLKLMAAIRYDARAMGNHEPDFGAASLGKGGDAVPLLAANVRRSSGEPLGPPYLLVERAGVRVGILGLAYPNTPLTTAHRHVAELVFDPDSAGVVRAYLPRMRAEGAQLIVVLSHLGLSADQKLAADVPGIDVIVGGHSHNRMQHAKRVGTTLIVQAGAHGSDIGRLDLYLDGDRVLRHRRKLITVDHARIRPDGRVAALAEQLQAPHRAALTENVGTAAATIARAQTIAGQAPEKRDAESSADSLFADIIRQETNSDIALLPGVGYGIALQPGPISAAGLRNLVPHESKVVTLNVSGAQVREILEQSLENVFTSKTTDKVGGMVQVSGIRFAFDAGKPPGQRVRSIRRSDGDWDEAASYRVATNSLLAQGGHNYRTLEQVTNKTEHGLQYHMIRRWMQARSPVTAPEPGRIERQP